MLRHESCKGRVFAKLVLTFLWLGCSQAAILLRGHDLALLVKVPSNPPLPVVRVALAQDNGTIDADNRGLSGRAVAGIAVGSALGGILVASIVMLSCCLRGIKKNSFNRENPSSTSDAYNKRVELISHAERSSKWIRSSTAHLWGRQARP
uniref:Uncharacterized protein n=1 Tax=Physcomitrium patens TaxID=3218 RepID=A0A7I4CNL4_PHYPA